MKIKKIWFNELPQQLRLQGYVVVIDAYAASANMCILLSKSPKRLLILNEDTLKKVRQTYKDTILVGESDILPPREFLFSNRLKDMYESEVKGKNVLWMSLNGSRVFEKASDCVRKGKVIAGSFHNANAVIRYLLTKKARPIYLVMAGERGYRVIEDKICADLIERRLLGQSFDWEQAKRKVSKFVRSYYDTHIYQDLPFLVDYLDKFALVPICIKNNKGFLEMRAFWLDK